MSTATRIDIADVPEWERSRVGDRLACFATLLPAHPTGPVVLVVSERLAEFLRYVYSGSVTLAGADAQLPAGRHYVRWDGRHLPLTPGRAGLVIVDTALASASAVAPALASDGTLAVLGPSGEYAIYPDLEHPEQIWKRGWPTPARPRLRAQLRRGIGLRVSGRRAPHLQVSGQPKPTIADVVLDDLAAQTGVRGQLVGIETAGQTILRVRQPTGELAVRLHLTSPPNQLRSGYSPAAEIPALRPLVLPTLAVGMAGAFPWVATKWVPGRRPMLRDFVRADARRWQVVEKLAGALATQPTGRTHPGWARAWVDAAELVPDADRDLLVSVIRPLDGGLPTGWCHGDPWPPNVLLDGAEAAVIDWNNACRDAPVGLDRLLMAVLRQVHADRATPASACCRILEGQVELRGEVAGRPFDDWDDAHRTALVAAAFVLMMRNRSLHDIGDDQLRAELDQMQAALGHDKSPDPQLTIDRGSGRAARGAAWLGLSAAIVKGSQTICLLVMAALLAPSALGVLAIAAMIANVAQVLTDLGTSTALVYWRGEARSAARTAVTIALALNVCVVAVVWLLAPWLSDVLRAGDDGAWVIRGLTSVLPCYGVAAVSLELLRRHLRFARRIVPDVVAAVVGAVVTVVLAEQGHGLDALVIGQIVQGVLTLLLSWVTGGVIRPGWRLADARPLLRYGGHLTTANLLQLVLLNVDYVIVARVLGSTKLGQYSLAFRLAYLPYLNVAFVIAGAAFPYLCRLRGVAVGHALERIVAVAATVLVPLCLGVGLFADQVQLLGAGWAPAVPAIRWLAVYAGLLSAAQFAKTSLNAVGRPKSTMQLQLLHLLVLVAVLLVLTRFGITAVALGQALAAVTEIAAATLCVRRYVGGVELFRLGTALLPTCAGGLLMSAVVLALHATFPGSVVSVSGLLVIGAIGLAAYAVPVGLFDRRNIVRTAQLIARPS